MAGIKSLRKIQFGKETTSGNAVAASTIWRGTGTIEDQRELVFIEEDVGVLQRTDRSCTPKLLGAITLEDTPATFEQLPYILEAGIDLVNTGATDTSGSGKIYTYTWPTTQATTLRTFTIEGGDDQEAEEMAFCHVPSFTIAGKQSEVMTMSADFIGRTVATTTFTADQTVPAVEEILFGNGVLFIDTVSSIGTTTKSNTLLEMSYNAATGQIARFPASGNVYFARVATVPAEIELQLTFEHDGSATAEKAFWKAETARALRLKFEGSTLTSAGSTYSKKTLIIDLYGTWSKFDALSDDDGNDTVVGTFRGAYNATGTALGSITVVNQNATIT